MLAAAAEAEPGEEPLLPLTLESQRLWPDFACELSAATDISCEYRGEGTLVVALNRDDAESLRHSYDFQRGLGLELDWLNAAEARRLEPHLRPGIAAAVFSRNDHQVENRALARALIAACRGAGVTIHEHCPVAEVVMASGAACGVETAQGREDADVVVLAAGAWSREVGGIPAGFKPPVRPIKGQMLAVQMNKAAPLLRHVVWLPNGGYLVPRNDGRLIVGGTVEEKGFDDTVTAGGMLTLLEAAWRAMPAVEELPIAEIWVGHRPGSRDDAPILGHGPLKGLFYATGHHRNGILLAPVTADAMARLILDDVLDPAIRPFGLERFLPVRAAE